MITTDALLRMIKNVCEAAVKEALQVSDCSPRRLLNVEAAGNYLSLSEREVYNMIANGDLATVRHGRRVMLDVRDLEQWVTMHKSAGRKEIAATV